MPIYEAQRDDLAAIHSCVDAHGFCLVRNVFSDAEMQALKDGLAQADANYGENIPDLISCAALAWPVTDSRVLAIARRLLGARLVYYPETNVSYEAEIGALTLAPFNLLHCDATGMPGDLKRNWRSADDRLYQGYRFGIYFQDYSTRSGGLKVGIGTHRGDPDQHILKWGVDPEKKTKVEIAPGVAAKFHAARIPLHDVPSRPGDLVVWNLRTIHSAGARVLKMNPTQALHPIAETRIAEIRPDALRPVAGPRLAMFFDLAAPAEDIDLYIKSRSHILNDMRKLIHARHDDPTVFDLLAAQGIQVRFDYLFVYLARRWTEAPAERETTAARLLRLADRHEEFSTHFPLFDQAAYRLARGKDDARAVDIVLEGVARHNTAAAQSPGA